MTDQADLAASDLSECLRCASIGVVGAFARLACGSLRVIVFTRSPTLSIKVFQAQCYSFAKNEIAKVVASLDVHLVKSSRLLALRCLSRCKSAAPRGSPKWADAVRWRNLRLFQRSQCL